jgi:hypothetical protein
LLGSIKNPQVFVFADGKVTLKDVRIGEGNGENIEVLGGLTAGEIVITSGHINLTQGSNVQIVN